MRLSNLDLGTLRTLVLANDLGSYGQAGERTGRTPSAVSLQMRRLQEAVGAPLFRKSGRGVALTGAGEIVLRYARRMLALNDELLDTVRGAALTGEVRLGVAQDFADLLPPVLARFAQAFPLVVVELRIEGSTALAAAVQGGELDLAVAIGLENHPDGETIGELPLQWIASAGFRQREELPLPLVTLGPQCAFRKMAIGRLDEAGRRWRLAALSPSLAGLWAAVLGGLGVTVRTGLGVPPELVCAPTLPGLPVLPSFRVTLHVRDAAGEAAGRLREYLVDALSGAGIGGPVAPR